MFSRRQSSSTVAAASLMLLASASVAMADGEGRGNGNAYAYAYGQNRGGPLPLLGVSALGQGLVGIAGGVLLWRRRARNKTQA